MNTQNTNQQLYGEPLFIEGTAGKKQVPGEPQFVSGRERHAEQLTPLYADEHQYHGQHHTGQVHDEHRTGQYHGEHHTGQHHGEHSPKPETDHVHFTIHTDDPAKINLEEFFQITPDGQIKVTPEEERSHRT
jgi:hypothetical protein